MNAISNSDNFGANYFVLTNIQLFKKIFVFLLSMQALRSGCWGENNTPIFC